jgi:homoserine O-acetyltransferase/O-succinyltransferase
VIDDLESKEVHSMETFELGNFQTTTGFTFPKAELAYDTFGTLNTAKDNAILFPNFLCGTPEALETWIGGDHPLDPREYFIILPGLFGGGFSSSPSNTAPPFDRGAFPPLNIADDVLAQRRLVTEKLGIDELQLVLGWSVGSLQAYEWAIRFPDMVKRLASIAGAPRPSTWTRLWLRTVFEEPITSNPAWNDGFCTDLQAIQDSLRHAAHAMAMTLVPHRLYREELWRSAGFASVDDFIRGVFEGATLLQDPGDLVSVVRKTHAADPGAGGDLAAALSRITAKTFVFAFTGDPMFPAEECKVDADRISRVKFREISSLGGHLTTFALFEQDKQAVDDAIHESLTS